MLTINQNIHNKNPLVVLGIDIDKTTPYKLSFAQITIPKFTPELLNLLDNYNNFLKESIDILQYKSVSANECEEINSSSISSISLINKLFDFLNNFEIDDPLVQKIVSNFKKSLVYLSTIKNLTENYLDIIEARKDFESGDHISLDEAFTNV